MADQQQQQQQEAAATAAATAAGAAGAVASGPAQQPQQPQQGQQGQQQPRHEGEAAAGAAAAGGGDETGAIQALLANKIAQLELDASKRDEEEREITQRRAPQDRAGRHMADQQQQQQQEAAATAAATAAGAAGAVASGPAQQPQQPQQGQQGQQQPRHEGEAAAGAAAAGGGDETGAIQALLANKIAQLELDASKRDEEEREISKASRTQLLDLRKQLEGIASADDRLRHLQSSYLAAVQQRLREEREAERFRSRAELYQRDAESRMAKLTTTKTKLEALCRELQRQNKLVMEESRRVAEEEQGRRNELSKKFHETIGEITARLEEQGDERMRQLRENETLREKLRNFAEQYDIREQHYATQLRAKELEKQLLEARLKQQAEVAVQEALKAQAYLEQATAMAKTEADLRGQVTLYAEKFEQFQETLSKSNDVFATFKSEMDRMAKTIAKLERDKAALKKKADAGDAALIELAEERNSLRALVDQGRSGRKKLEDLCRALQAERTVLRQEIDRLRAAAAAATATATATAQQQQQVDAQHRLVVAEAAACPPQEQQEQTPDYTKVYAFLGSMFDANEKGFEQKLGLMAPLDRVTAVHLISNLVNNDACQVLLKNICTTGAAAFCTAGAAAEAPADQQSQEQQPAAAAAAEAPAAVSATEASAAPEAPAGDASSSAAPEQEKQQ
eukprot:m51a1_g240 hypothetical protein (682) ;mRNA; f:140198-142860